MATFVLDPYADWTAERLKSRCRELCRALSEDELIIAMMVEYTPSALDRIPPEFQDKARRINAARRDDEQGTKGE